MKKKTNNEHSKCSIEIRNMPTECFLTVCHGRKPMQRARSLHACLLHISTYSNGDGTFTKNGKDYSPSYETLTKRFANGSLSIWQDALRELRFLSWTRAGHRARRSYIIHLDAIRAAVEHFQDSRASTSKIQPEHFQDSSGTLPRLDEKGAEHFQDSSGTLPVMECHPSFSVLKPPSTTTDTATAAGGGLVGSDQQDQEQGTAEEGDESQQPEWTEDDQRAYEDATRSPFVRAFKEYPLPENVRSGITVEGIGKAYKDVKHALKGSKHAPHSMRLTQRAWVRFLGGRDFGGIKKATAWKLFAAELLTDWLVRAVDDLKNGRMT